MNKIRVLHFELYDKIGGIESFLLNLYKAIDRSQFQFDFVSTKEKPGNKESFEELGGNVYTVASYKDVQKNRKDIISILNKGYDIIHIHKNSAANILPIIYASKYSSAKIVVHSHNTSPSSGRITKILHILNKSYLIRKSDCKMAGSEKTANWMFGVNSDYYTVKNGIYCEDFLFDYSTRIAKRKELGINNNSFVIGHVGKFTEQKNHEYLINVFNEVNKSINNSILLLIGVGELQQKIRNQVKQYRLENNVMFLNERKDIPSLLWAMDIFLFPSIYEGLSVATIEAQASGLPSFFSDGVNPESGMTSNAHWFALQDTPSKVASSLIKENIIHDISGLTTARTNGNHEVVEAGYDMRFTATEIERIYIDLINDKKYT